jgi:hypothetical protein
MKPFWNLNLTAVLIMSTGVLWTVTPCGLISGVNFSEVGETGERCNKFRTWLVISQWCVAIIPELLIRINDISFADTYKK